AGAFTGGLARGLLGKIDLAHLGTLFFDEISELPLELQGKLLRVLQEKEYYRVGGLKRIRFETRIICATNADLTERVQKGLFRRDLYYRLNVALMFLPPLRERKEEIIPLAYYFLHKYSKLKGKKILEMEDPAERILNAYHWPGNIRELQNIMNHLTTRYRAELNVKSKHLLELYPALMHNKGQPDLTGNEPQQAVPIQPLKEYINEFILQILKKNAGNKSLTAQQLGISRHVLYNYLQKMEQK
ncbi:MAG: sigma 54-interacting transcriptional regulator, partial [Clostridia bacterium]|nr:sigma 54-interacting transcriptional regulator [Clostridia bacterium]